MPLAHQIEIILGLLVAATAIATLARRIKVPYPILLFIGGAALGFIPGLPRVHLHPDVVFLMFLPPLLYAESWWTSWREFKENLRPISLLAFGLVFMTTTAVALVAHRYIGMGWGPAFVLGAVLAPTDTVAPAAVLQRLRVPRRIEVVLNGESLVNDASALVIYRYALAAVVTGMFSPGQATLAFFGAIAGGLAIGLAVGWAAAWLHRVQDDYTTDVPLSLLVPFAAYLPAEWIHASGVVAVVTAGIYVGRRGPRILSASSRIRAIGFWQVLVFILNGLLFILVGLQLPAVLRSACNLPIRPFIMDGILVSLTLIVVRILWVFPATYLPRLLIPSLRRRDPSPNWRPVMIVAWTGLRGGVSLAAALAIPEMTASGAPFPNRDLILFLTFCALLATLVGQGLLLAPLIHVLGITSDGQGPAKEAEARTHAAREALHRLDALSDEGKAPQPVIDRLRHLYERRIEMNATSSDGVPYDASHPEVAAFRRLRLELLRQERDAVIRMRDAGKIDDTVLHRLERDIDLEELRMDAGGDGGR